MQTEKGHACDVERRHPWVRKAQDGHAIDIVPIYRIPQLQVAWIDQTDREMHQVINNECKQLGSAQHNSTRCIYCLLGFSLVVFFWTCGAIALNQLNGGEDVQDHDSKQPQSHTP